jgi:HAE1 family hydrophobic/amphiphilic exporter-1
MAVFLPIVFLQVEAGQLFKDIAIAVACAVGFSLVVSMSLIPMLCSRWLHVEKRQRRSKWRSAGRAVLDVAAFGWLGRLVSVALQRFTSFALRSTLLKIAIILLIVTPCVLIFVLLRPPLDYLPLGNRDFIFGLVFNPPGINIEEAKARCRDIEDMMKIMPEVRRYFTVALIGFRDTSFLGVQVKEEFRDRIDAFKDRLQATLMFGVPGLRFPPGVWVFKMPVFRESMGGKSVDVNIRGAELAELASYAAEVEGQLRAMPGVGNVRNTLDVGNPERRIIPNRERAADLGFDVADISDVIQTLVGGKIVDTYKEGGDEYDLTLIGTNHDIRTEEDLRNVILDAPNGAQVTLRDLADIVYAEGPTKVEHIDQDRSVTLTVQVAPDMPLQKVVERIEEEVVEPLRGRLPTGYSVSLYGAADRLSEALRALTPSIALAVLITYLLMAALFESFVYPFVIMFTVPLSWAGALLGFRFLEWLHLLGVVPGLPEFNVITLLGFVILTGVVVNNAILIIHQALNLRRGGASQHAAIEGAVRQRVRPIFMSSTTSVLGMLPLAIGGGSGTELYTGLGSAVVGGLLFSTMFTLVLIPAAFALFLDARRGLRALLRLPPAEDDRIPAAEPTGLDFSPPPTTV